MSRPPRDVNPERAIVNVLLLLSQRIDKPCPTRDELMAQTGYQQRALRPFLQMLQDQGLIEIESRALKRANLKRMRVAGGRWTGWTKRKGKRAAPVVPSYE